MAIHTDFLRELDRFQLVLKKKVISQYQGARASTYAGSGLTFKDYKDYNQGDDFRQIDWKVYARTDKYYIKRYEEERNMTVHVVVDASGSMNFGKETTKFEYAAMLGLGFAYIALKNNERFEFSTFAEELRPLKPRKGLGQLLRILSDLQHVHAKGKSEFAASLESYKSLITSKSFVVIVSDFLYPVKEIEETLARFKNSHVLALQVLDPLEKSFAIEGDLILQDAESDKKMRTFITRRVQQQYRDQMAEHTARIAALGSRKNLTFVSVTTDMPVFDSFFEAFQSMR